MPEGGEMDTKFFAGQVKAAGPDDGLADGQFEAYASVFSNVDSYGDVVVKGAFADTLAEWAAKDAPIPLLFGHNMQDPDYNIGHILYAKEDDHGLLVRAQLDLEAPKGLSTYRLIKGKRIDQMSFAYKVLDSGPGKVDGADVLELRKLQLLEISVVPVGANDQTAILAVKAGRTLSAKTAETVNAAVSALAAAKSALEALLNAATNDDSKASVRPVVKGEEPEKVKGNKPEEPAPVKPEELPSDTSVNAESWETYQKAIEMEGLL